MKSILYLMHIPWQWIKQRPHFIAEYLSEYFQIDVLYKIPLKVDKKNLINREEYIPSIKPFFQFPFKRFKFLKRFNFLNKLFFRFSISQKKINSYHYIWITSISLYPMISHLITDRTKIIWDCMDDELEFKSFKDNKILLNSFLNIEKELIGRADIIICSSDYLSQKIQSRTSVFREIFVINNAIEIPKINVNLKNTVEIPKLNLIREINNIFMYIGAISEWFDFKILFKMLEENNNINIVLIGPNDVEIPKHNRIIHLGTIKRDYIFDFMRFAKALIMPFKVNELIKSVNPVKIYEYIWMGLPVIAPHYGETEKFSDYIYLYNSQDDFINISKSIVKNQITIKKTKEENRLFAESNQWKNRCQEILKILAL